MLKVVLVAGTRPEVIKLAPVYLAIRESLSIDAVFLSSGQHREMLDQAFAAFGIKPDLDLGLMTIGQSLPEISARVIESVAAFLKDERPNAVLFQGDTTTVLAGALAAFYERIPIGHVEAGLRTHNMQSPWPEEMNRRLVSPLCRWHFAPTDSSRLNLERERIPSGNIHVTGNTVIDALLHTRARVLSRSANSISASLSIPTPFADRFIHVKDNPWILVTGHRRESFGSGMENICQALLRVCDQFPELGILYPVHLNPRVREPVNRLLAGHPRIALIEPAAYCEFVWLMEHCTLILSDSGGIQEEAPSLGKPVLVMRDTTERPEGIDAGTCRLVGTDPSIICSEVRLLIEDPYECRRRSALANPYGDGGAAQRIVSVLERDLDKVTN
jgi:UDP-N-acetylglucosamine 2-epimerase (non-hydrolysing)